MNDLSPVDLIDYLARKTAPERELARLFRRSKPLVIFDIGACEGEESIRYARAFPRARVYAFEPLPQNQRLILSNLRRYGAAAVELVPLALSDRFGSADFHVSSGRPSKEFAGRDWNYGNKSSSLLPPASPEPMNGWIEFKETIRVQTDTLDSFCGARAIGQIDFIHMDVQGAEHLVLAGACNMLTRTTAIWFEVSDQRQYLGQKLRGEMESIMRDRRFDLVFEERREVEGDQFYVNARAPRALRYLALRRARAGLAGARSAAAAVVRKLSKRKP